MKKRLLVSWEGSDGGADLVKTAKRLIKSQVIKWQRPVAGANKKESSIRLNLQFTKFDATTQLDSKLLSDTPYLYIYFTECSDGELYKQRVKPHLADWLHQLIKRGIDHFLICVVVGERSKLQLRQTVVDKIKVDFLMKHPNRLAVLNEPSRDTPKSRESWAAFCDRVIETSIETMDIAFDQLNETVREQRESRNQPGWDFGRFFILQEEIAILYESLGLYADALIQYDELDAMLTQYLENSRLNQIHPKWLKPLLEQPITRWEAFLFKTDFELELMQRIRANHATLIDFRNYIFSRKARLLTHLSRSEDLARAALDYVQVGYAEMKSQMNVNADGLKAWALLASMESNNVLECIKESLSPQARQSLLLQNSAALLDIARRHLATLGKSLQLISGSPDRERIDAVLIGFSEEQTEDQAEELNVNSPVYKVRQALDCPAHFEALYLELCELAMASFKLLDRDRSAAIIGGEVARFYFKRENYEKAEIKLLAILEIYENDGWDCLALNIRRELVDLYIKWEKHFKLSKIYYSMINGDNGADIFPKFIETLQLVNKEARFNLTTLATPTAAQATPSSRVDIDDDMSVQLVVHAEIHVPQIYAEIWFDEVHVEGGNEYSFASPSMSNYSMVDVFSLGRETVNTQVSAFSFGAPSTKYSEMNHSGGSSTDSERGFLVHNNQIRFNMTRADLTEKVAHPELRYSVNMDSRTRRVKSSGISSPSTRQIRHKSSKREKPNIAETAPALVSKVMDPIDLKRGANTITFKVDTAKSGRYSVSRFCLYYRNPSRTEFVSETLSPAVHIEVLNTPPVVTMGLEEEKLYSGVNGKLNFTVQVGSRPLANESMKLAATSGLEIVSSSVDVTSKWKGGFSMKTVPISTEFVAGGRTMINLKLPDVASRSELNFSLLVRSSLQSHTDILAPEESHSSSMGDLDELIDGSTASSIQTKNYDIRARITNIDQEYSFSLQFHNPFIFEADMRGDLVLFAITNISRSPWKIKHIECKSTILSTDLLKGTDTANALMPSITNQFLWKLDEVIKSSLEFNWRLELESNSVTTQFDYMIDCNGNKPFFTVRNLIEPFNHMTQMFPLKIQITNLSHDTDEVVEWQIGDNRSAWAICGKTRGTLSLESGKMKEVHVDLMPLFQGSLRLPQIRLRPFHQSEHDSSISSIDSPILKSSSHFGHEFKNGDVKLLNPLNQIINTDVSS